jgi:hypothetical protein
MPGSSSVSGKAWVNQILETNPVPVIWVTNRIEQIDPAFRRRFQYHLMLKSRHRARAGAGARALAGVPVGEGFAAKLASARADAGADPHRGALCAAGPTADAA